MKLRSRRLVRRRESATRVTKAMALVAVVWTSSCVAYLLIGLSPFDAIYQTVVTVTTVGYAEIGTDDPSTTYRLVTLVVMVIGVGSTLYALGIGVEVVIEGRLEQLFGRRRMHRDIAKLSGHLIVCGGGRVGSEIVAEANAAGERLVVIDRTADRLVLPDGVMGVLGDATDDAILEAAGVRLARSLVSALSNDADNVYVTLSARAMKPDLFIVARAHAHGADAKLIQAGADRVVNPQFIGGRRMATYALQPNVAEFLDVTMHDGDLEWRLEEVTVSAQSSMATISLGELNIRERVGCLILAARVSGRFLNNPGADVVLSAGTVLIAMGTPSELAELRTWATA